MAPTHTHTHTHTHTQTHTLNTAPTPTPFSFFNSQAYSFAHTRHIPAPAVSLCTFSILFKLWFVVQLDVCITWYLHVGVCARVRVCVGVYVCVWILFIFHTCTKWTLCWFCMIDSNAGESLWNIYITTALLTASNTATIYNLWTLWFKWVNVSSNNIFISSTM
jgi:hypothetical protein